MTVEDPVEYQIEGVTQIPVNRKAGLTFASALRSILRHDPDVIMVGEMRDRETAEIAIQAALTGHLVFSTLHTNDAPAASRAWSTWASIRTWSRPLCRPSSPSGWCACVVRSAGQKRAAPRVHILGSAAEPAFTS